MLTWRIRTKVGGVLTDADALPTITITLVANGNIMFLDQTMSKDSTGTYSWAQPSSSAGIAYRGTWSATVAGVPVTDSYDQTEPSDSWYYSNRTGVQTIADAAEIKVAFDFDDDGNEDSGAMTLAGQQGDGYIDLFLANEGVSVPVVLSGTGAAPAHVVKALADVSNHLVMWFGWHHRGLLEMSRGLGRPADGLAGLMSGYKAYADEQLERIVRALGESSGQGIAAPYMVTPADPCPLVFGYSPFP